MNSISFLLQVERKEINYIQSILESYDGMAIVRTTDPRTAVIEVSVSPGCESLVFALLDDLRNREKLECMRL